MHQHLLAVLPLQQLTFLHYSYIYLLTYILYCLPPVLWRCWLDGRKGIRPVKNMGGWWRWALVSPDGVAPSQMVSVSASVNLPLHHKVQTFSSGTGSPVWSRKKGRKTVVVWWWIYTLLVTGHWEVYTSPKDQLCTGRGFHVKSCLLRHIILPED